MDTRRHTGSTAALLVTAEKWKLPNCSAVCQGSNLWFICMRNTAIMKKGINMNKF